jgi:hypothetical protein
VSPRSRVAALRVAQAKAQEREAPVSDRFWWREGQFA